MSGMLSDDLFFGDKQPSRPLQVKRAVEWSGNAFFFLFCDRRKLLQDNHKLIISSGGSWQAIANFYFYENFFLLILSTAQSKTRLSRDSSRWRRRRHVTGVVGGSFVAQNSGTCCRNICRVSLRLADCCLTC